MTTSNTNSGRFLKSGLALALALGVGFSSMLVTDDAEARRGGKGYYSQSYDFDRPMHGYEGHARPGYYCSYKRLPKRVCRETKNGETCKIVGWTLEQNCY
ncbi:MAG: hypothetical protein KDJ37_06685 [Hyphomicrobiaceae bacterium]|nr:hypothetical protein [Hyphomicrobiaceae bacterium]